MKNLYYIFFSFKHLKKIFLKYSRALNITSFFIILATIGINIPTAYASEEDYWSQQVNVFNFSCTDGDVKCWIDNKNSLDNLPLEIYTPLKASQVQNKHHICVSFPHLKDSYWVGVA